MKYTQRIKSLTSAAALLLLCSAGAAAQQQQNLTGEVLDKGGAGMGGVAIIIVRNKKYVGRAVTKGNGSYVAQFESGTPVTIKYEPYGKFVKPVSIEAVAGQRDQRISVVLERELSALSLREGVETYQEITNSYSLAIENLVPVDEARRRYAQFVASLRITLTSEDTDDDIQLLSRMNAYAREMIGLNVDHPRDVAGEPIKIQPKVPDQLKPEVPQDYLPRHAEDNSVRLPREPNKL